METKAVGTGAIAGMAAGASAGILVGTKKANEVLGDFKKWANKPDAYVGKKVGEAKAKFAEQGLKKSQIKKFAAKVAEKAKADITNITNAAKKTKNKWLIGLAAAGAVVGTTIGVLASKKKKTEAAEK